MRARFLWQIHYGVGLGTLLLLFNLSLLVFCAIISYCKCYLMRQQWHVRLQLQTAKDARIEQLASEKERLDYERKFAIKAKHAAGIGALGGVVAANAGRGGHMLAGGEVDDYAVSGAGSTHSKEALHRSGARDACESDGTGQGESTPDFESSFSAKARRASKACADGADGGGGVGTRRTQTGNSCGEANATAIFVHIHDEPPATTFRARAADERSIASGTTCSELVDMTSSLQARPHSSIGFAREHDMTPGVGFMSSPLSEERGE